MDSLLSVKGVRVFRPSEYEQIRSVVNDSQRAQLDGLLLSGMRYIEAQRFYDNPTWLDKKFIHLPHGASLKVKSKFSERYIRLSNAGELLMPAFLRSRPLPSKSAWNKDVKRWAVKAGVAPDMISCKSTRKTWESWLIACYPRESLIVCASQGHTTITEYQHYLNIAFSDTDKTTIQKYTSGFL